MKDDGQEKIVVTEYCHGRLTRMREMTEEELKQEQRLQTQRGVETKARRKRIRQIIEGNGFTDYDQFFEYVDRGGDSTADLREKLEKDKWEWIGAVDKERMKKIRGVVTENGFVRREDYIDFVMSGGDLTADLRKYLSRDESGLERVIDGERREKIRGIVEEHGFTEYEEYLNYVANGGDSTIGFRENLKNDKDFCIKELKLKRPTKKKREKSDGKLDGSFQITSMTEMSRLILGLRKFGLGDKELADFLLWVESGDAKYEPGQLGGQQGEGQ